MTQSFYDPNQQQYPGQPGLEYVLQPPQVQRTDTGRSMAIIAIICFGVAWVAAIASIFPIIGYVFLCFALIVHILGFIFLAIAISKWPGR